MTIQIEKPIGAFRHTVSVQVGTGRLIYISGLLAGNNPTSSTAVQTLELFGKMRELLKQEGGDISNLVKINAYLSDMRDYTQYNEVRNKVFAEIKDLPASATVGGVALVHAGHRVEIEGVAFIPN